MFKLFIEKYDVVCIVALFKLKSKGILKPKNQNLTIFRACAQKCVDLVLLLNTIIIKMV